MRPPQLRLRLAAILAADAVAYSRLMSADARATIEALETARRTFQTISVAHGGRVIDTAGDSVLTPKAKTGSVVTHEPGSELPFISCSGGRI